MELRIEEQLSLLHLSGVKQALAKQQEQTMLYQDMSFEERLQLLLSHELVQREQRKISRLEKQAGFRLGAQVEQIDYRANRGFNASQIRELLQGNWLKHQQNLLLTGAAGCGKSYLACALGRYFIRQGMAVRYYRLKTLLEEMRLSQADGSYPRLLSQLSQVAILILDDWGMEMLDATERSNLLEVIDTRHGKLSTVVASQLPVDKWYGMIGEATFAEAILDRLIHRAIRQPLTGESMRKQQSKLTHADQNE
ncbi:ATP-binding protein [Alishewanella sp. WH16-1]|uniref:IS21-like element helper ATPase IstB n=1 Tax=Alishewanella sp. WH16-1 TaxID=1651088 RepID=UPI00070CB006|nr:IS21-like element helper ATPase IstB [Alishewanella sp. WH16-1]KRS21612.1 ATP-binding protein [Alishewanella sp. WH16-1]